MAIDTHKKAVRARNAMAKAEFNLREKLPGRAVENNLVSALMDALFGAWSSPVFIWHFTTERNIYMSRASKWKILKPHLRLEEIERFKAAAVRNSEIAQMLEQGMEKADD